MNPTAFVTVYRRALLAGALLAASAPALAWGPTGHRLVAELAESRLTPAAQAQVHSLLAGEAEPSLAGIANWADNLRDTNAELFKQTSHWHYVNIAENGCHYPPRPEDPHGDVVKALRAQTALLADRSLPREQRLQALKFVVHFAGDIHQPLHAGYLSDKGGNTFQINYRDKGSNLHSLWDSGMLNSTGLRESQWLTRLQALPAQPSAPGRLPADTAVQWAEHSCSLVVQPGFYPARPGVLPQTYVDQHLSLMEQQLQAGGQHLAALLNQSLGEP
ncbi:S1/P1 nuclease [Pseudoxanthomonas dokdonensis]|uniref:Endonuclease n=1 Tax=Pseudoxanthomonas dokdonensis TaxID=344882 RepID=A0A0R0CXG8_9GAMM|nr:S1/P1 nuclease [Pseudoxanthomonas dokdonensis]KRG70067.1 endonuclease [Pseudoxanthomonas dokdonensis]